MAVKVKDTGMGIPPDKLGSVYGSVARRLAGTQFEVRR